MNRAQSSLVVQLRTGKIEFRAFLFKRRVPSIEDPYYTIYKGTKEITVEYILIKY